METKEGKKLQEQVKKEGAAVLGVLTEAVGEAIEEAPQSAVGDAVEEAVGTATGEVQETAVGGAVKDAVGTATGEVQEGAATEVVEGVLKGMQKEHPAAKAVSISLKIAVGGEEAEGDSAAVGRAAAHSVVLRAVGDEHPARLAVLDVVSQVLGEDEDEGEGEGEEEEGEGERDEDEVHPGRRAVEEAVARAVGDHVEPAPKGGRPSLDAAAEAVRAAVDAAMGVTPVASPKGSPKPSPSPVTSPTRPTGEPPADAEAVAAAAAAAIAGVRAPTMDRAARMQARRTSWKSDTLMPQVEEVEEPQETRAGRAERVAARRVPYKNPMGGITQVPWSPTKRRGPIAAEYQSPGPACVALPNLTGGVCGPDSKRNRAPAFSFGTRPGGKLESPGPGPGQYNVTGLSAKGKDNPPAASLHSRPKEIKTAQTPAPGDYNPEKSEKIVHSSPKFTFGLKTQPGKISATPAPNVYNIPTVLGVTKEGNKRQAPAFTISGRQKEKPDDRINNPGPGSYNDANADNYKAKSPAYSISSRYQMPSDPAPKPGPGAHSPEKVYMNLRWAPNYSFGIKHSQYKGDRGFKLVQDTSKSRCTCTC